MLNVHSRHHYAEENLCLLCQQRFQRRFSINVWISVIGGMIIDTYLGIIRTLDRSTYFNFFQNELLGLLENFFLKSGDA